MLPIKQFTVVSVCALTAILFVLVSQSTPMIRSSASVGMADSVTCFFQNIFFGEACLYVENPEEIQVVYEKEQKEQMVTTPVQTPNSATQDEQQLKTLRAAYYDLKDIVLENQTTLKSQEGTQTTNTVIKETIVREVPTAPAVVQQEILDRQTLLSILGFEKLDCSKYAGGGKLTADEHGSIFCANDHTGRGGSSRSSQVSAGAAFSSSLELAEILSDETGSGSAVFGTSPTIGGTLVLSGGQVTYSSATKNIIANNTSDAWTLATSSSGAPLFSIDTTNGGELVTIGKAGGDVYIGGVGSPSNLIFEESSTIHGQGSNTLTFGTAGDALVFGTDIRPEIDNSYDLGNSSYHWDCVYYDATTLGTCSSDARLKDNVTDFSFGDNPLHQLLGLRPRTFTYRDNPNGALNYGFIAQEVLDVAPKLVTIEQGDAFYSVRYGYLQYLTIAAVQQFNTDIAELLQQGTTSTSSSFSSLFDGEMDSVWSRLVALAHGFMDGVLTIAGIKTQELCVSDEHGSTCINRAQLTELLSEADVSLAASTKKDKISESTQDNVVATSTSTTTEPIITASTTTPLTSSTEDITDDGTEDTPIEEVGAIDDEVDSTEEEVEGTDGSEEDFVEQEEDSETLEISEEIQEDSFIGDENTS